MPMREIKAIALVHPKAAAATQHHNEQTRNKRDTNTTAATASAASNDHTWEKIVDLNKNNDTDKNNNFKEINK